MSALRSLVSSTTAKAIRPSSLLSPSSQRLTAHPAGRHIRAPLITARHESQSAFSKFVETLKEQIKKNKELQESVKKLQDESGKAGDSDALKKAKDAFEKAKSAAGASVATEKLKLTAEQFKKATDKLGETVSETLKGAAENEFIKGSKEKTGKVFAESVDSSTKPIRDNEYFKNVKESAETLIQDTESRYGGYISKAERRRARGLAVDYSPKEAQKAAAAAVPETKEDVNAGESMVLHKDSAWKETWSKFKDTNPVMQSVFNMKKNYEDSDNVFVAWARVVTDKISDVWVSMLDETENAKTIRALQMIDPRFKMDNFMKEAREFIIPEIMDAVLNADSETLNEWCSEATYNVLTAGFQAQIAQGLVSDCKILELRNVELVSAKVLENDVPVLIISFNTQEVTVFRNRLTREVVFGKEDAIEECTYACVITLTPETMQNPLTRGVRIMDMAKHGSRAYI
ncbi:TIM44 subunit of mitochondria import inner membrane translocase [Linnemannia elongata AG-77]|uniref:Mitochondrial import inner membrane translocase subunit TIM44 n=1 Tax=Linnemannia elongata AG-77 TaxID=1314771 RepID=A0A197JMN3_9FUNG|nr:TIM44 subunit of mitochondria import inner membrane translocase [Linnemannia elongata AG-77]